MSKNLWSEYSQYFSNSTLKAAFTNKHFPYSKPDDRIEFAKSICLNSKNIVEPVQVHSNNVAICTKSGIVDNTDGIVTSNNDIVLSIQVADCIPIFLFDKRNHNFGLVHAGWRGVQLGIVENSISKMVENNSDFNDLWIILGPSIRQCCFEVGPEVGQYFDKKFQISGKDDRSLLDLQGAVINKLTTSGIPQINIIEIKECTHCSDKYHSFRRDGKNARRMIAMMGWNNQ